MSSRSDRIILAVAGVALAGAVYAVYRTGQSLDELTDPYSLGPNGDGTTGNPVTDIIKGARQIAERGDEIPAAGGNIVQNIGGFFARLQRGILDMSTGVPRGIRNNNPGNMRISINNWQGKIGNDGAFEVFDTMANGLRANMINLYSRAVSNGTGPWDTVGQVISEWAPNNENDTQAYIAFVERETGYGRNQILDPRNAYQMSAILRAIVLLENGGENRVREHAPELIPITMYQEAWRQGLQGRLS
jgi:hypothetical protein